MPERRPPLAGQEARRVQAHEALLETLARLEADDPEALRDARRFDEEILAWHRERTGWSLDLGDESVRLLRAASALPVRPFHADLQLRSPADYPREARDYACAVWTLWFAQSPVVIGRGTSRAFLLSELAEHVQQQAAGGRPDQPLDFSQRGDRSSLRRALRLLEALGVVREEDGSTDAWVDQRSGAAAPNAVYRFTDLAISLIAPLQLGAARKLAARLRADPAGLAPAALADGRPKEVRYWRALLSAPAFLKYDDPEAFDALWADRQVVRRDLEAIGDWQLSLTRYFARLVRPSGVRGGGRPVLSTLRSQDQAALLLCAAIRRAVSSGRWPTPDEAYGCVAVTADDLALLLDEVAAEHAAHWSDELRDRSDRFEKVAMAMRQAGLLRGPDRDGRVLVLPTAALYQAGYVAPDRPAPLAPPSARSPQLSFFRDFGEES
ncbi:MAG: DUF2398 family protein [Chloroflexi bacterium]|nr:DUF2398 family protein [Chloroflexota bacterium]